MVAPEQEDPFAVCHYCKKGILNARHKNASCKCGEKFLHYLFVNILQTLPICLLVILWDCVF